MEWQTLVDQQLVGTRAVNQAGIIGQDGNTWATAHGFSVSPADGRKLVAQFANPSEAQADVALLVVPAEREGFEGAFSREATGLQVGTTHYIITKADSRSIHGRSGSTGIVAVKTGRAVVIGVYSEGQHPDEAAHVVQKVAGYMIENGY